jgi:hypothetical protein
LRQPADLRLFQEPRQTLLNPAHVFLAASSGFQSLEIVGNVLGDRDAFRIKAIGFPGIENAGLDALSLRLQVTLHLVRDTLVRSGLDLALASAFVADTDVPNLALFA